MDENNSDSKEFSIEEFDANLPNTVTLLRGANDSKLYLVGTAHFSLESQQDVSRVIQAVKPDIVVVELCKGRANILRMDEKTIEEEVRNLSLEKMINIIKENGVLQGMLNILLLNLSAQLTRDLGMAPGGEFRKAFQEVKKLRHCLFHFGDRPIKVTLKRALSVLTWWETIKLAVTLIFQKPNVSREDVERYKECDILESMLQELTEGFPKLGKVFIEERDKYLTYSLQLATCITFPPGTGQGEPVVAVGIVGIGHTPGILKLWGKVKESDIPPILIVNDKPSKGYFKKSLAVGLALYIGYKVVRSIPSSFTTKLLTAIKL
ncbi:traB domain-containing protein [Cimex lectularius]|uniref:TraB domain-containing protein n=1 Tax=Cimex lectularius TaxID=79782 RepID=A0A8I6RXZ1_CIMLE|nr:traB domain-containing protein [Cimex lectularius]